MHFDLRDAWLTGIDHLDSDHRRLVDLVNAVEQAERRGDVEGTVATLGRLRAEMSAHFRREEGQLRALKYPGLATHADHHARMLDVLDRLTNTAIKPVHPTALAHACYHHVINFVLREDMQFLTWLEQTGARTGQIGKKPAD